VEESQPESEKPRMDPHAQPAVILNAEIETTDFADDTD